MHILIAGASGMIGQALVNVLKTEHECYLIGRRQDKLLNLFPDCQCLTYSDLNQFKAPIDVIIHLSGQNIANFIWTEKYRKKLIDSRVNTAKTLCDWAKQQSRTIRILAANAIGYYGCYLQNSPHFTEESKPTMQSNCFSQTVTQQWQQAWSQFNAPENLCIMRFGVVLAKNQGMLKRLMPSYRLGAGAILGAGQQTISWIDIHDLCKAINFILNHPTIHGAINLVTPNPCTQKDFAKTLAKTLNRPLFLNLPACIIKSLMGQMGEELLLSGQAVYPKRLLELGFQFDYPELAKSLNKELS
jgi:uncharacterized protein (TIGR01777 family)